MRILVHIHAYGDCAKAPGLVDEHAGRIRGQIDLREMDEVGRLEAEYQPWADRLGALDAELTEARRRESVAATKTDKAKVAASVAKHEKERLKVAARIGENRRARRADRRDSATRPRGPQ